MSRSRSFIARNVRPLLGLALPALVAVAARCLAPTELKIEITTNASCVDVRTTVITLAKPFDDGTPSAVTNGCKSEGRIGSIVVVPGRSDSVVRVLTGIGRSAEDCAQRFGPGCILSRRRIRFVTHESLRLPIEQSLDCAGIRCDELSSCRRGRCVPLDDLDQDAGTPVNARTCPSGRGSAMVRAGPLMPSSADDGSAALGDFCIDAYETTIGQYQEFIQSNVLPAWPPRCSWKPSINPGTDAADHTLPVANVDWCDAWAYCAWAGKRLCGQRPGGDPTAGFDLQRDEHYLACAGPQNHAFPYGDSYDPNACNIALPNAELRPVGASPGCQGGYPGLYDMSGNVEEWRDVCTSNDGGVDSCRDGPGSFKYVPSDPIGTSRCDDGDNDFVDYKQVDIGIRCCADLR